MKLLHSTAMALLLLVLAASYLEPALAQDISGLCENKCQTRCSEAGVQNRCLRYCRYCCAKCNCVPSGTYGNRDECPCYRDMLTKSKKPKCP